MLHPGHGFSSVPTQVEVRWDPLTGHAARLVRAGSPLLAASHFDLEQLARSTMTTCPFCPERIDSVTPKLPPEIWPEGRIRHGRALLFPNLLTYAKYSAVGVYAPELHYLPLDAMTPELMSDNLAVHVDHARAVIETDPDAAWASINANHMLPSGSSLFHPHLQSSVDPAPWTFQAMLAGVPRERFTDYVRTERQLGERYIVNTGSIEWIASFAPIGFNEVRAFVSRAASPGELDADRVSELGVGIASILNLYAELGFQSFNMALYGAPPSERDYTLNLRMVCRSNVDAPYRSDATYFERLHWQAMVDTSPEELAQRARARFGA